MIPAFTLLFLILFAILLTRHGSAIRATSSIGVGLIASYLALRSGVPLWRDWQPFDACDFGLLSFIAAWLLAGLVMR